MNIKGLALALLLAGLCFADLIIPENQPICNLYGIIRTLGTIAGVLAAAYGGFILATCHETKERGDAKNLISGAIIGLMVIWLAPLLIKALVDSNAICGW